MKNLYDSPQIKVLGTLTIVDANTGACVLKKTNAIHQQNLALVIARALSNEPNGTVYQLCFGNGGTFLNSSNILNYRPPNIIGASDLYNETYHVIVDDQAVGVSPSNSVIPVASAPPAVSTLVVVTAVLSAAEPAGQATTDNLTTDTTSPYLFDEIGLKSEDGLLLTHLVFSPIEKTANRTFLITYTLNISVA